MVGQKLRVPLQGHKLCAGLGGLIWSRQRSPSLRSVLRRQHGSLVFDAEIKAFTSRVVTTVQDKIAQSSNTQRVTS